MASGRDSGQESVDEQVWIQSRRLVLSELIPQAELLSGHLRACQSALQLLDVFVEWLASENAINFHETHSLESSLSIIWISFLDSSIPHKESTPHDLLCLSTFRKFLAESIPRAKDVRKELSRVFRCFTRPKIIEDRNGNQVVSRPVMDLAFMPRIHDSIPIQCEEVPRVLRSIDIFFENYGSYIREHFDDIVASRALESVLLCLLERPVSALRQFEYQLCSALGIDGQFPLATLLRSMYETLHAFGTFFQVRFSPSPGSKSLKDFKIPSSLTEIVASLKKDLQSLDMASLEHYLNQAEQSLLIHREVARQEVDKRENVEVIRAATRIPSVFVATNVDNSSQRSSNLSPSIEVSPSGLLRIDASVERPTCSTSNDSEWKAIRAQSPSHHLSARNAEPSPLTPNVNANTTNIRLSEPLLRSDDRIYEHVSPVAYSLHENTVPDNAMRSFRKQGVFEDVQSFTRVHDPETLTRSSSSTLNSQKLDEDNENHRKNSTIRVPLLPLNQDFLSKNHGNLDVENGKAAPESTKTLASTADHALPLRRPSESSMNSLRTLAAHNYYETDFPPSIAKQESVSHSSNSMREYCGSTFGVVESDEPSIRTFSRRSSLVSVSPISSIPLQTDVISPRTRKLKSSDSTSSQSTGKSPLISTEGETLVDSPRVRVGVEKTSAVLSNSGHLRSGLQYRLTDEGDTLVGTPRLKTRSVRSRRIISKSDRDAHHLKHVGKHQSPYEESLVLNESGSKRQRHKIHSVRRDQGKIPTGQSKDSEIDTSIESDRIPNPPQGHSRNGVRNRQQRVSLVPNIGDSELSEFVTRDGHGNRVERPSRSRTSSLFDENSHSERSRYHSVPVHGDIFSPISSLPVTSRDVRHASSIGSAPIEEASPPSNGNVVSPSRYSSSDPKSTVLPASNLSSSALPSENKESKASRSAQVLDIQNHPDNEKRYSGGYDVPPPISLTSSMEGFDTIENANGPQSPILLPGQNRIHPRSDSFASVNHLTIPRHSESHSSSPNRSAERGTNDEQESGISEGATSKNSENEPDIDNSDSKDEDTSNSAHSLNSRMEECIQNAMRYRRNELVSELGLDWREKALRSKLMIVQHLLASLRQEHLCERQQLAAVQSEERQELNREMAIAPTSSAMRELSERQQMLVARHKDALFEVQEKQRAQSQILRVQIELVNHYLRLIESQHHLPVVSRSGDQLTRLDDVYEFFIWIHDCSSDLSRLPPSIRIAVESALQAHPGSPSSAAASQSISSGFGRPRSAQSSRTKIDADVLGNLRRTQDTRPEGTKFDFGRPPPVARGSSSFGPNLSGVPRVTIHEAASSSSTTSSFFSSRSRSQPPPQGPIPSSSASSSGGAELHNRSKADGSSHECNHPGRSSSSTYHPSFPPKSSWSGGGFSYGLGAKSFAGSSHAHSSSNPAPARHPSGVSDDIAKLRRARSEESEKSRLLELAEEEEYAEEKSRFLEELFRYKPWLLWDRRMIENARFSELKQRFFICKDEKSIDLSSSEALKEVEYIKREVWSKRDLPRESKSDMELLDDARFYNSKSGDFLRTRYSRATAYQRLGLTRTASKSDVRKAFRKAGLLFHPDNIRKEKRYFFANRLVFEQLCSELFMLVEQAYQILGQ